MQKVTSPKGGIPLAVGLSLGLSVGMFAQNVVINKFFPTEQKPEKIVLPAPDSKLIEQLISQDRKINLLESNLIGLKDELRERSQQVTQAPVQTAKANGNVFELGQVIEANNLANASRYERQLEEQRKSLLREQMLKVEGEVLKVENKYRPVINKIKELEAHLETQRQIQQKEAPARILWISCQSLLDKLRFAPQQPLERDPAYDVLKQFASNNNPLAISILDSIPAKALKEGVQSEESLAARFCQIEKTCKRVALVDAHGGGLANYLLSYLQSLFILDNIRVPEEEVSGQMLVDPSKWSTFDILARVRFCLANHNLDQAIRYANQLRGQARVVARDWIRDARMHLITRQAFTALSTQAEAIAVDSTRQKYAE